MQKAHPTSKVVNLHPGWVKTRTSTLKVIDYLLISNSSPSELGGPDAQIETFESVEGTLRLLQDIANGTKEAAGMFWAHDGTTLPW